MPCHKKESGDYIGLTGSRIYSPDVLPVFLQWHEVLVCLSISETVFAEQLIH